MATSQSDEDALEQLLSSGDSYSAQLSKELSTLLPDPPSRSPRSASIPGPSSPSATAMPSQTIRPVMQTAPMMHPVTFVSPPAGAFWPASHQTPSRVGPSPNMQAPQQQHVMQTTLPTQPLLVPYAFVPFWTGCPLPFSPMAYPQIIVPAPAPGENIFTLGNPVTPASLKALQKSEKLAKYRQKRLKRNVLRPADPTRSALAATRLRDEHGQFLSEERVLKMKLDELKSRLDASEAAKSNLRSKLNATEQKLRELKMQTNSPDASLPPTPPPSTASTPPPRMPTDMGLEENPIFSFSANSESFPADEDATSLFLATEPPKDEARLTDSTGASFSEAPQPAKSPLPSAESTPLLGVAPAISSDLLLPSSPTLSIPSSPNSSVLSDLPPSSAASLKDAPVVWAGSGATAPAPKQSALPQEPFRAKIDFSSIQLRKTNSEKLEAERRMYMEMMHAYQSAHQQESRQEPSPMAGAGSVPTPSPSPSPSPSRTVASRPVTPASPSFSAHLTPFAFILPSSPADSKRGGKSRSTPSAESNRVPTPSEQTRRK